MDRININTGEEVSNEDNEANTGEENLLPLVIEVPGAAVEENNQDNNTGEENGEEEEDENDEMQLEDDDEEENYESSTSNESVYEDCNENKVEDDPEKEILTMGCEHYKRKCQLVCPEPNCGKVYTCRFCHDEKEPTHNLERHKVKEVVCLACNERQPSASNCRKCSILFGKYHCLICNLFNDELKDQYHCEGCGICRVGPREHFYHCPKCDMCLPIKAKDNHQCVENASRTPCAICMEDIHTSRIGSHIPKCGHLIHMPCFKKMLRKNMYTCPICNTSLVEMKEIWAYYDDIIKNTPMPPNEEFNKDVTILCRDCHQISTIKFHVVGLKCGECGGYNTVIESRDINPSLVEH